VAEGSFFCQEKGESRLKKRYQIEQQRAVQQFLRIATENNPNVQMVLPLAEIAGLLQEGAGDLLRETGLVLMQTGHGGGSEVVGRRTSPAARRPTRAPLGERERLLRSGG
jgi:hypothetical protein